MKSLNDKNKCYFCKNKRNIPGDAHISCIKPDHTLKGNQHGIGRGWFFYPFNFDPCWIESTCKNFESKEDNNGKKIHKEN